MMTILFDRMNQRMKIGAIILARLDSRRLPGKALIEAAGRPLVGHAIDICRRVVGVDAIVLATSDRGTDDPLAAFADREGIDCVRGSVDDVAGRFLAAMRAHALDAAVRFNGDSPMHRAEVLSRAVARFREGDVDLVTNIPGHSFPYGVTAEVLGRRAMEAACADMVRPEHREHVTLRFYDEPGLARLAIVANTEAGMGDAKLVVDDRHDLQRFVWISQRQPDFAAAPLSKVVALAREYDSLHVR